jgi:hypothetical protein
MIRYALTHSAEAPWRSLNFFPLPQSAKRKAGGYRVHVRTDADGAVVSVDPRLAQDPSQEARTFLIDLSGMRRSLAELRLKWPPGEENLMVSLAVDASDDLVVWSTIQHRAAIADIHHGDHRLISNTISLARSMKRYLRLRQLDSGPAIALIGIEGRVHVEGRTIIRAFTKVDGQAVADLPGVFEYRTNGAFPVDRVNLVFDQANSMADAMIESRSDLKGNWSRRCKDLFYRIDVDGIPLTSAPRAVPIAMDRHWRLSVDSSESTMGSAVPGLEIGYRPHDLFFVARGSGPFTLAFGSAMAKPLKVRVATLFDGISRQRDNGLERWVRPQGRHFVLGGPQRLLPLVKPLPMRRILLWSMLIAGVMVVAGMAWRLARRMRA